MKATLIEIDRYVKSLGDSPVVNTWVQKYLFTKSVSILVNQDKFFRKYMYLMQCYILIRTKFSPDGVLGSCYRKKFLMRQIGLWNRIIGQQLYFYESYYGLLDIRGRFVTLKSTNLYSMLIKI